MTGYRSGVPDNWFVDPVQLGVPGVRRPLEGEDGNPLGWQTDALCAQTDPEAFFPEKGGSTRDAKKICTTCDVRGECLEYALQNDERFGIWGGLSERERRKLKRRASGRDRMTAGGRRARSGFRRRVSRGGTARRA
jgi:WhiB family transcriptional regulator, redox-sensing transcriptional regulator